MKSMPVAEAAQRLSISPVAAYEAMKDGRLQRVPGSTPARVLASSVQRLADSRREDAQRRHSDLCVLARHVDSLLHAPGTYKSTGREALGTVPADAYAIFGRDVLEAASSRDRILKAGGCPTCYADQSARVHDTRPPRDDAAHKILLGQPCPRDQRRWAVESEEHRRQAARRRVAERARQKQAAETAARQELEEARTAAQTAASRLANAERSYGAMRPAVAREAAVRARARGAFTVRPPEPENFTRYDFSGCDCDTDRMCAAHREVARKLKRPGDSRAAWARRQAHG